jgi:hypothetical protein
MTQTVAFCLIALTSILALAKDKYDMNTRVVDAFLV